MIAAGVLLSAFPLLVAISTTATGAEAIGRAIRLGARRRAGWSARRRMGDLPAGRFPGPVANPGVRPGRANRLAGRDA
jgi:hypothetical protein